MRALTRHPASWSSRASVGLEGGKVRRLDQKTIFTTYQAFCGVGTVLGIVGALVGGFLFSLLGAEPVTGFNIYSIFVAVMGAIVVLAIYHAVIGRRAIP